MMLLLQKQFLTDLLLQIITRVELTVFNGTAHSFDGKTEGTDGASSAAARNTNHSMAKNLF